MAKKINIDLEIDADVKGLGCKGKDISHMEKSPKEKEELRKVFSGEDFNL